MNIRLVTRLNPAAALFTGLLVTVSHASDPVEELKSCARIGEPEERYACYDDLGRRLLEDEAPKTPALPDEIGGAAFEERSGAPHKEDRGLVTSCKKGGDGRWYFYFDNGQVWKESNTGRHRFRNCEFIASVYRDGFGYKMRIEENDKNIRVSRIR